MQTRREPLARQELDRVADIDNGAGSCGCARGWRYVLPLLAAGVAHLETPLGVEEDGDAPRVGVSEVADARVGGEVGLGCVVLEDGCACGG